MKGIISYAVFSVCCTLVLCSCQKGIVWGSIGTLQQDADNNCMPVIVNGHYGIQKALTDSNTLIIEVKVTLPGTYHIYTDTLNGYYFSATGSFTTSGLREVTLTGLGKPDTAGTDHFSIYYLESICQASILVTGSAVPPSLPAASYTFQDNNKKCLPNSVYGTYAKKVALDPASNVTVNVNVSQAGSYHITTDTINGYWFSGTGEFLTSGIQSIMLYAAGTPVAEGTDKFSLWSSDSTNLSCGFSVTVLASIVPVSNKDLLPLAANNYWVYDDLIHPGDSLVRNISGTTVKNDNTYFVMYEQTKYKNSEYLFRKTAGPYYEYASADKYTNSFKYSRDVDTDLLFLNEILTTGAYWESAEVKDKASFGQTIFLKYTYICTEANTVVALNGYVFGNVYKISMMPQIRSEYAGYGLTDEFYTYYYAKGIGLIYYKSYNPYNVDAEIQIRRWSVN